MKFNKSVIATSIVTLLSLTACGGGSTTKDPAPVTPTNSAPSDIALSNAMVNENAMGVEIGTLSATDANAGDTFTYTLDNDLFTVDGSTLKLAADKQVNFEQATSHTVNVTVTDNGGLSFTKELTIEVNDMLDTYTFTSKFTDGSSVSYSGQIARHVLINELNYFIANGLDTSDSNSDVNTGVFTTKQDVLDRLNKYFRTTEEQYDNFELKSFGANTKQKYMTDISSSLKKLGGEGGKIAGRDQVGQHKTWGHTEASSDAFIGWGAKGDYTPESLVDFYFDQLADNVITYLNGAQRVDVNGEVISKVYITEDGTDLKQLIQKFLLMAVAYSQATDDYFGHEAIDAYGNDLTGSKGLLVDNTGAVSGKPYTNLEHQFDEGFGYFGAARDYLEHTDADIAGGVYPEGEIDLLSSYNFGNSVNAAKRDKGATVATDFTHDAMTALIAGRALINENAGHALTEEQMTELTGYRDQAVSAWEKAVASTVIHYINEVTEDLEKLGTEDFNYSNTAKHWSELKGFALGLQFNPYSPLANGIENDAKFAELHQLIGDAPVLDSADVADYLVSLSQARDILQTALEFDAENVANW